MNKTNYFKFFGIAAFAVFLSTTVNAQNSAGKMDRERVQARVSQNEISAKSRGEAETTWIYSVMQVVVKDRKVEVRFDESNPKPTTSAEKTAYKMAMENQSNLKEVAASFTSETDVLNYLAQQGYELVSVLPNAKDATSKMYYLRTKLVE